MKYKTIKLVPKAANSGSFLPLTRDAGALIHTTVQCSKRSPMERSATCDG